VRKNLPEVTGGQSFSLALSRGRTRRSSRRVDVRRRRRQRWRRQVGGGLVVVVVLVLRFLSLRLVAFSVEEKVFKNERFLK
jgi:hypothetical protein